MMNAAFFRKSLAPVAPSDAGAGKLGLGMWGWITGSDHPAEGEGATPSQSAPVIAGLPTPTTDVDFKLAASEMLEEVR